MTKNKVAKKVYNRDESVWEWECCCEPVLRWCLHANAGLATLSDMHRLAASVSRASCFSRSASRCFSRAFSPATDSWAAASPASARPSGDDHTGQGPSVGTVLGILGCLEGSTLRAMIMPNGMCCSMWQWNCQMPGKLAWKRMTAHERCHSWNESLSSGAVRSWVTWSVSGL